MNTLKNPARRWTYWRISRSNVDSLDTAKRDAPMGFKHFDTQPGQFVFRKPLPDHVLPVVVDPENPDVECPDVESPDGL